MDLLSHLTDDQLALLGCFGAIVVSATIMSLSYYVGPASRTSQRAVRQLPHVERIGRQASADDPGRRAA